MSLIPTLQRFRIVLASLTWLALIAAPVAYAADLPEGKKIVSLVTASGEKTPIGSVTFTKDGDARLFTVQLDAPGFRTEFLSMRDFRCLSGEKEMWCHIPYPYEMQSRITPDNLMDLEYALMFLFKPPAGYGISTWNGLYFKLSQTDDGGFEGDTHDVNLEPLGVPPAEGVSRPLTHADLNPSDPTSHRFARIEIR